MTDQIHRFVDKLESLREDRAALARLRRGLGHDHGVVEMYPYVVPFLPDKAYEARWYFLIAALFGLNHLPPRAGESFGKTFLRLDPKRETESTAKRFQALLNAHEDDLGSHLRHAVSLLKSREIGVDYKKLLLDLTGWHHPEKRVQLRWAKDFWSPLDEPEPEATESVTASTRPILFQDHP